VWVKELMTLQCNYMVKRASNSFRAEWIWI
jgi:hypothetical protein